MTVKISQSGLDAIKRWEGLRTTAYCDDSGVWTIGYGHTAAAGQPFPCPGMKITEEEAEAILLRDLVPCENAVETLVKVPLSDNQFAALVSFCFNVGLQNFKNAGLLKKLNAADYDAVLLEFMKWVFITVGGKKVILKGLVNRRAAESGLWVKDAFVSSRHVQPAAGKDNPLIKPEMIGTLVGALTGLVGFTTGNGPFQWTLSAVMLIACLVVAWHFIHRLQREGA